MELQVEGHLVQKHLTREVLAVARDSSSGASVLVRYRDRRGTGAMNFFTVLYRSSAGDGWSVVPRPSAALVTCLVKASQVGQATYARRTYFTSSLEQVLPTDGVLRVG